MEYALKHTATLEGKLLFFTALIQCSEMQVTQNEFGVCLGILPAPFWLVAPEIRQYPLKKMLLF